MIATLIRRTGGVAVGIAVGQGLVLLVTPYLARHFPPAAFGSLALLLTISNLSTAIACLRYDLALPSSPENETRGLLTTALLVAAGMGAFAAALLSIPAVGAMVARSAAVPQLPLLVGACVLLVGWHQATCAWMLRRGAYGGVAGMRLSQGAGFSALALVPGVGLLWAHVLSFGAGVIGVGPTLGPRRAGELSPGQALRVHHKFPLLSLPGALLDVCGYSVCIWVIATFYGTSMAGNYSQIQRLTGAPMMLVSISLGQILLRHTAELDSRNGELGRFLSRMVKMLAALAAACLLLLWLFGEPVFSRILGSNWRVDRLFITLVAVAVFFRACVSPLSSILITLRRFKIALLWQVIYFASACLLLPFVASRITFEHYVAFYALHEAVQYSLYLYLISLAARMGVSP
jgi:O-antigen/teichoic acid export membrane protein